MRKFFDSNNENNKKIIAEKNIYIKLCIHRLFCNFRGSQLFINRFKKKKFVEKKERKDETQYQVIKFALIFNSYIWNLHKRTWTKKTSLYCLCVFFFLLLFLVAWKFFFFHFFFKNKKIKATQTHLLSLEWVWWTLLSKWEWERNTRINYVQKSLWEEVENNFFSSRT